MSKGGKGGSATPVNTPSFGPNDNLGGQAGKLAGVGDYEQQNLQPVITDANWANTIATGGNSTPFGLGGQYNPYVNYTGSSQAPNGLSAPGGAVNSMGEPIELQPYSSAPGASGQQAYNTQGGLGGQNNILGPYLGAQANALSGAGQVAAGGVAGQGGVAGENLPASGLYADQQAMIDSQTQSGQAAIQQQLASEGLSGSTQNAMLKGEIGQQGAAEAGQLIQGNIQLAQSGTQIQQTAEMEQYGMFSQLASADSSQQAQMWNEAMQGQGQLGQYFNNIISAYGMQDQYFNTEEAASAATAQVAAGAGGGGGGGGAGGGIGSLIGSLGGLFASSAGGTSAVAGIGSAIGSAGSALSAAF